MKVRLSNQLHDLEKLENFVLKQTEFNKHLEKIYSSKELKAHEAFINLPFNKFQVIEILELKKKINAKNLKKIFVLGIGGSSQGTKAVYELLKDREDLVEMEFLDYINSKNLENAIKKIKRVERDEYLIFVISKSGNTIETIYNLEILENYLDISPSRIIFITDEKNPHEAVIKHKKYHLLNIPKQIGGRYSVFTHVGLAPLTFAGVNIVKLLEGAAYQVRDLLENNSTAPLCAASKFLSISQINESLFPDNSFLELGKWEKQLFNESLGKKEGIMFSSFGNFFIEVHSSLQYYLNSQDLFLNIISFEDRGTLYLKETSILGKNFVNTDVNEINRAIEMSVKKDLISRNIPFISYEFDELNEYEIGSYLQAKMIEAVFLGLFYKINPFTQPDVQSHKETIGNYLK